MDSELEAEIMREILEEQKLVADKETEKKGKKKKKKKTK